LALVQYQVRTARITDAERIVTLLGSATSPVHMSGGVPRASGDLLRQLVDLPHAVVLVAESGRHLAGAAVLALRPSVRRGGFIGTIDILAADPAVEVVEVTDALMSELLRSARNKGCVAVEAAPPEDPAERDRWIENGFGEAESRIVRDLAPAGANRT
jgi:hypothetical protein